MKVVIGCDHGGFDYKDRVVKYIRELGHEVIDVGTFDGTTSVDYPDFAEKAANMVAKKEADRGILICGTGIGISIAANKVNGIRCAVVHDNFTARLTRMHNDANMIAFGARVIGIEVALDIVKVFLETQFEGGRHANRVRKIQEIEERN